MAIEPTSATDDQIRMKEIRDVMSKIPEGRELLAYADKQGLPMVLGDVPAKAGAFFGTKPNGDCIVMIGRDNTLADQVSFALHELRHSQQFEKTGKNHYAWNRKFADPMNELLHVKVIEADAHVFQIVTALKLKEAGQPEIYDQIVAMSGEIPAYKAALDILKDRPPTSFSDEATMQKALFAAIFARGLPDYNEKFFRDMSEKMDNSSPEGFHEYARNCKDAGPLLDDTKLNAITEIGGKSYMQGMSLDTLRAGVLTFMKPHERILMEKAVDVARVNKSLSLDEYNTVRGRFRQTLQAVYSQQAPALQQAKPAKPPSQSKFGIPSAVTSKFAGGVMAGQTAQAQDSHEGTVSLPAAVIQKQVAKPAVQRSPSM